MAQEKKVMRSPRIPRSPKIPKVKSPKIRDTRAAKAKVKKDHKEKPKTSGRSKEKRVLSLNRKIFLAIRCVVPGESTVSSTGICVEEKAILRDVLDCWASGIFAGLSLPKE
ncbi:unnamed protein product, partial [Symbiodinium necroappetens]